MRVVAAAFAGLIVATACSGSPAEVVEPSSDGHEPAPQAAGVVEVLDALAGAKSGDEVVLAAGVSHLTMPVEIPAIALHPEADATPTVLLDVSITDVRGHFTDALLVTTGPVIAERLEIDGAGGNRISAIDCTIVLTDSQIRATALDRNSGDESGFMSIELHEDDESPGCSDSVVARNRVDSWISVVGGQRVTIRDNELVGHGWIEIGLADDTILAPTMVGIAVDGNTIVDVEGDPVAVVDLTGEASTWLWGSNLTDTADSSLAVDLPDGALAGPGVGRGAVTDGGVMSDDFASSWSELEQEAAATGVVLWLRRGDHPPAVGAPSSAGPGDVGAAWGEQGPGWFVIVDS